jgi:hypothetical protein
MDLNFLDIALQDVDKPIYRVFSIQHLLELFETGRNTLVHPSEWDDPFENVILSCHYLLEGGERVFFADREKLFAQCWTFVKESDAMWRIYSKDKQGVRVRTTPRRLLRFLWTQTTMPAISCFLGRVQYKRIDDFKQFIGSSGVPGELVDTSGQGQARSLLWKRKEFRHEREVRLILFNHSQEPAEGTLWRYAVDPNVLFDQIVLDPRLSPQLAHVFMSHFKARGYPHRVFQSGLYHLPRQLRDRLA